MHDALCVARNHIRNNSIVYGLGGGAAEIACSLVVDVAADRYPGVEQVSHISTLSSSFWHMHKRKCLRHSGSYMQYAIRAFAEALDSVPMALAANSGLQPIETLPAVKSQQIKVSDCYFAFVYLIVACYCERWVKYWVCCLNIQEDIPFYGIDLQRCRNKRYEGAKRV